LADVAWPAVHGRVLVNAWPGLDASRADEVLDVGGVEADVSADSVEGDAPFGDQSSYEAGRGAEPFSDLLNVQHAIHFGRLLICVDGLAFHSDGEFRSA
jgi:hypothetical protein